MKFLFSFITFLSVFALSLSLNPIKSIETNDSENNSQVIEEVVINGVDENALKKINNILFKYNPNGNDLDKQFENILTDYSKTQTKLSDQLKFLVKNDGFKDVMFARFMPLTKEIFKFVWKNFLDVLDSIWSAANHLIEETFNRRLPTTYYMSAKVMAKQLGNYLCQQVMAPTFSISTKKAVHHCSTIFSSLTI